jgi:hypothetical protein
MTWTLAHRPRGAALSTKVESAAETSGEAIEELRSAIPDDHVILYVRAMHQVEEMPSL